MLFIILISIKKIKLLFLLIIIFITQYFITTEQFYHLGNSRFEMYNMLGDINWLNTIIGGNRNLTFQFGTQDLLFHNGFLTFIFDYGLLALITIILIFKLVYDDLKRRNYYISILTIFFIYNLFEPSNIFGNWGSIVPFWWFLFNANKSNNVRYSLH